VGVGIGVGVVGDRLDISPKFVLCPGIHIDERFSISGICRAAYESYMMLNLSAVDAGRSIGWTGWTAV
jgi:hypothetical protein